MFVVLAQTAIVDDEVQPHGDGEQHGRRGTGSIVEEVADDPVVERERTDVDPEDPSIRQRDPERGVVLLRAGDQPFETVEHGEPGERDEIDVMLEESRDEHVAFLEYFASFLEFGEQVNEDVCD